MTDERAEGRTLTDDDVKEIVAQLKAELVSDFYGEVGRGVWAWVKKAMISLLLLLAVYGMLNGSNAMRHIIVHPPSQ